MPHVQDRYPKFVDLQSNAPPLYHGCNPVEDESLVWYESTVTAELYWFSPQEIKLDHALNVYIMTIRPPKLVNLPLIRHSPNAILVLLQRYSYSGKCDSFEEIRKPGPICTQLNIK